MKTVHINAVEIMSAPNPLAKLCSLFGLPPENMDDLSVSLKKIKEPMIVECANWKEARNGWEVYSDLLEGVQQHSSYFYLIWGTNDDMVNPDASSQADELINPEWANLSKNGTDQSTETVQKN